MGSICGEEEEKIYVAVRLRPLNEREITRNDVSDWECINNTTIIFKNTTSQEQRSLLPAAYTFDRVFGYSSHTRQVYEEAAKKVALSVLSGINSTIFAYGQTGSGKTFTMSGITEYAITDIYDYIDRHCERSFVLKFSAMEIYNEAVKDPLRSDGPQLRLLDDPERGTVVDKLTEVKLRDSNHLRELLSICAAQRQIGETSLNEQSSRSHQILRLSVESEGRHLMGGQNSSTLTACVNFVDLAGSERASQTLSAGTRLKEGCHINRSLLTLGTVIRKLSKGRNGHVPYRDSKLTRILQNALGGNARTAIICTMSPAHSHVEQSRNTLHFANCAKQVSTNAQVNVVTSEKALVKQLQRELARLMNELRTLTSSSSSQLDNNNVIHKMEKEIQELTVQRDLAHARVEDMLRECQTPMSWVYMHQHDKGSGSSWTDDYSSPSEASEIMDPLRFEVASRTSHLSEVKEDQFLMPEEEQEQVKEEQFLSDDTSPRLYIEKYFGPDPCQGWEKITMHQPNNYFQQHNSNNDDDHKDLHCIQKQETSPQHARAASASIGNSPRDKLLNASKKSKSCEAIPATLIMDSPPQTENIKETDDHEEEEKLEILYSKNNSQNSTCLDEEEEDDDDVDDEQPEGSCVKQVIESKPAMDLGRKEEEIQDSKALKQECADSDWKAEFERQKKEIIKLWDACGIPLVHRTYFLLLFKGDPSDAVYLEVELRRLSFLKNSMQGEDQSASIKSLNREREMLSKRLLRKYSAKEREDLYSKWGIDVKSKQRRLQLSRKLWSDATNMERVNESASIVAKLEGFKEQGEAPKEMFGLSLLPKHSPSRSFTWTSII